MLLYLSTGVGFFRWFLELPLALQLPVVAWFILWKGIALWRAAQRNRLDWYTLLLVVNTAGILEIVYIFAIAPRQRKIGEPAPEPAS